MKYVYQMSTGTVNHKSFLHCFNSEEILHGHSKIFNLDLFAVTVILKSRQKLFCILQYDLFT